MDTIINTGGVNSPALFDPRKTIHTFAFTERATEDPRGPLRWAAAGSADGTFTVGHVQQTNQVYRGTIVVYTEEEVDSLLSMLDRIKRALILRKHGVDPFATKSAEETEDIYGRTIPGRVGVAPDDGINRIPEAETYSGEANPNPQQPDETTEPEASSPPAGEGFDPRILSVEQTARGLGIELEDVMSLIEEGRLPFLRLGRYLRIRESDVHRMLCNTQRIPEQ